MDSYQAVYDATKSMIGYFDGNRLIDEIASRFDFSHHADMITQDLLTVSYEQQRPAILFRPKLTIDGNQWCALYGDNF